METQPIKILDCTLRDGGYYNNWDFGLDLVITYLEAMAKAPVDVVEIGFRSPPKRSFMGPFVYSLDYYLETLPLPEHVQIGVMINANDYLDAPDKPEVLIDKLFLPEERSPVGLVRIAVSFDKATGVRPLAGELKALGYVVGLNMMQSHGKEQCQYQQTAKKSS